MPIASRAAVAGPPKSEETVLRLWRWQLLLLTQRLLPLPLYQLLMAATAAATHAAAVGTKAATTATVAITDGGHCCCHPPCCYCCHSFFCCCTASFPTATVATNTAVATVSTIQSVTTAAFPSRAGCWPLDIQKRRLFLVDHVEKGRAWSCLSLYSTSQRVGEDGGEDS